MLTTLRNIALSALVIGSVVLGACAGESEDPDFGAANVQACNDYLDTITGLDCWDDNFDPMIDCEATYSGTTACDISEYFDCVGATYSCDQGVISVDAVAAQECASLANCE